MADASCHPHAYSIGVGRVRCFSIHASWLELEGLHVIFCRPVPYGAEALFKGNCALMREYGNGNLADGWTERGVPTAGRPAYAAYLAVQDLAASAATNASCKHTIAWRRFDPSLAPVAKSSEIVPFVVEV